jgi:hypothetical protein
MKKILLLFCALSSLKISYSQNYIITNLDAGNCNNINQIDYLLDSLCKINHIKHLYFFQGIDKREFKKFSFQIFDRVFHDSSIVSEQLIEKLSLKNYYNGSTVLFVKNDRVYKTKSIYDFEEKDIYEFKSRIDLEFNQPIIKNKQVLDSFKLNYSYKIKLDSSIRINKNCKYKKKDSILYILEPLFNKMLYKVSCNSGKILNSFSFDKELNDDSFLYYHYINQPKLLSLDSLKKLSKLYKENSKIILSELYLIEDKINVALRYPILTIVNRTDSNYALSYRNYNTILTIDDNFKVENYYFDTQISYDGKYPVFYTNVGYSENNNLSFYTIRDYFQNIKVEKVLNFELLKESHSLKLTQHIDSFIVTSNLEYNSNSNIRPYLLNSKYKAWHLFNIPFIYFSKTNTYLNLLENTIISDISEIDNYQCFLKSYTNVNDEIVNVLQTINNQLYLFQVNVKNQKVLQFKKYDSIIKFNLNSILSQDFNVFYVNFEYDFKNGNYVYFE